MKYESIYPQCDLTVSTLELAALKLGPAFIFDLYVAERNIIWVRSLLKGILADVRDNPLAPYINLHIEVGMGIYEWYLSANGKSVGSVGA